MTTTPTTTLTTTLTTGRNVSVEKITGRKFAAALHREPPDFGDHVRRTAETDVWDG